MSTSLYRVRHPKGVSFIGSLEYACQRAREQSEFTSHVVPVDLDGEIVAMYLRGQQAYHKHPDTVSGQ